MSVFKYEKDSDGIVTVTMDMTGPVNAMNDEYGEAMTSTVAKLEVETGLCGVVITSAKKAFFAGGDLNDLAAVESGSEEAFFHGVEAAKLVMRRLEKLPVPVVAAVNGAAMGGGFEICLACNHRIAWSDKAVIVGFPEVRLGLMPGAGGVVRLTNLLGFEKAQTFLQTGKSVSADKAVEAGLIHETVRQLEELVPRAKAWIQENKANEKAAIQPWDQRGYKVPGGNVNSPELAPVLMAAPSRLRQKTRGLLPAPERILETAVEALRLDFDTALRVESRNFVSLIATPQAKNLITSLFYQLNQVNGGASRPKDIPASLVKKVGIVGAGMMGQGIAFVSAMVGIEVVLKDISLEAAEKGKAYSDKVIDKRISLGLMDGAKKNAVLERIKPTDNNQDLDGCDLIIEAVFENIELKNQITASTEGYLTKDGIWGSNTSTLPITGLAEASVNPEKFIGLHFFSPVDRMALVEIICGEKTSDETLAKAFDFTRQIKKTPIVVNDSVGFFTSRTFGTQLGEAAQMLAEGVHPVRIETLLKLGVDVGETQKEAGLYDPTLDPTPEGTELVIELVKKHGRGGRYHGGGYYEYGESGRQIWPGLLERYYKPGLEISDDEIKDRLLFRSVIESLKCLQEGVLRTVADGNIGSLMGIGAPTWTGGYIQFVNTYGLEKFIDRCNELAASYGERFLAPGIVEEKLAKGELFC
jgi:3-hydroxyacyl-CoA dehydrogenase/enoyl-CoA hydratase/3-hydroxybutyryl-CoA epimerase